MLKTKPAVAKPPEGTSPENASAHLSALIESTQDLIWSVDLEYRLLTFNKSLADCLLMTYGVLAAVESRVHDRLPPEIGSQWRSRYARALLEGPFREEYQLPDGRWLELSLNQILQDGQKTGVSVFGKDITERKQALDALRDREASLREAEILAQSGSASWDVASDTSTWSEGLYRVTGRDPSTPPPNWEGRARLYTPESYARLKAAVQHALTAGEVYDLELQIVRPDGTLRWTHARGAAIRNELGEIHKLQGTLQDITEQKLVEIKLRDSEERFRATFEQAAIGIIHVSFEGQLLRCNQRFAEILGYSPTELLGRRIHEFTPAEYLAQSDQAIHELAEGQTAESGWEKAYIRKDGSLVWVWLTSSVQRDGEGRPLHIITFVEDISARKGAEENLAAVTKELREKEFRYRSVFQTSLDALSISRLSDGELIDVNKAFLDTTGFTREEVIGRSSLELSLWANPNERQIIVDELRQNSTLRDLEILFRKKSGETFWGLMSASVIEIDGVECVVTVARDITDIKHAVRMIRDLSFYDPLTHLPNRRSLLSMLERTQAGNKRNRALLFIDLDNFKSVNDAFGHEAGDLLLQEAARRITECVLGEGTVARVGGDEFAVVLEKLSDLPEVADEQAGSIGEKLRAAGNRPYLFAGKECHCSFSIGITVFGPQSESSLDALKQGEIAMFKAKEAGRNITQLFSPALQSHLNARVLLENELREGIKAGQFELYFQPEIRASQLIGAEALIRWNHPSRGLLAPDAFIGLAEKTGLILPLGDWVLQNACQHIAAWTAAVPLANVPLAVNISAMQFRQADFVEHVLAALNLSGANPFLLKLELTETALVEDIQDVNDKMAALKSRGITFSMDDFGTGYSSLAYLKRLPLDELKIDRAFVQDMMEDGPSGAIARVIISIGQVLNLSVIAEGVETDAQRDALLNLGCDSFQGYLFSRPVPADEFERTWLRGGKKAWIPSPSVESTAH
jgi:diguanylate cyclase (GGDEF)-like protein/PAS domain S-box-containing protein